MGAKRKSYVPLYIIVALLFMLTAALVVVMVMMFSGRDREDAPIVGFSRDTHDVVHMLIEDAPGSIIIFDDDGHRIVSIGIELGIFRERTMDFGEYNALIFLIRDNYTRIWATVRETLQQIGPAGLYGREGQELLGEMLVRQLSEMFNTQRIAEVVFTEFNM